MVCFVSRAEMARQVGRGRATLVRWEQAGIIPPAKPVSSRLSLYDPSAARAIRAFAGATQ